MDINAKLVSQRNAHFIQQRTRPPVYHSQAIRLSTACPIISSIELRPQTRQQVRAQQHPSTHYLPTSTIRRLNTPFVNVEALARPLDVKYITLVNLTRILDTLQTRARTIDHESSTVLSSTTSTSARRVQQHLQDTANRWWKPVRSVDTQLTVPVPSSIRTYDLSPIPSHLSTVTAHRKQQSNDVPWLVSVRNCIARWKTKLVYL